jgi:septal ring factor EnvC (AmiA/AmiB activator)
LLPYARSGESRGNLLARILLGAGLLVGVGAARPTHEKPPDRVREQLQRVERDRAARLAEEEQAAARARAAEAAQQRLAAERIATAARLRTAELATLQAAQRMDALAARRREAEARLKQRAADLAPLLPLIARLSHFPAETLLAVAAPPEDALRGVLVLRGMSRQLEAEAEALRREQAGVARLSNAIVAEAPRLAAAEAEQARQAAALDRQIADARADARNAADAAAEAEQQAAADAAKADSLRDAIARLEADRRTAEARARAEAARAARTRHPAEAKIARRQLAALALPAGPGPGQPHGQLTTPVAGTVVQSFGAATEAGPAEGISFRASPAARVVAPCGGKIVFAAPFRSYKLLLILDCGAGYDFVLAGLDRLDVQVGRRVQAGEPVGAMAGWDPHTPADRPTLYLELRRNGQPVNPAPWLKARA